MEIGETTHVLRVNRYRTFYDGLYTTDSESRACEEVSCYWTLFLALTEPVLRVGCEEDAGGEFGRSFGKIGIKGAIKIVQQALCRGQRRFGAGAEPVGDAYFGFYLLAMGHGRARSPERISDLLHGAGFHDVKLRRGRLPMNTRVITARR